MWSFIGSLVRYGGLSSNISSGLSPTWSLIMFLVKVVFDHISRHGGLSSGWSLVKVVSNQGALSSGWSVMRVVPHQGGLSPGGL